MSAAVHGGESSNLETITNSLGMTFVKIKPGEFMMGLEESPESLLGQFTYENASSLNKEQPQHRVRITRPFYMAQHEVTIREFLTFYHEAHYRLEAERDGQPDWGYENLRFVKSTSWRPWAPGWPVTQNHPAVYVSWNDAQAFCDWLSDKEMKTYRLPTEAEWEYCCRAGSTSRYSFGNPPNDMVMYGNGPDQTRHETSPREVIVTFGAAGSRHRTQIPFPFLAGHDGYAWTAPVANFKPNAFGMYDMHGNVREWCSDWYSSSYYKSSSVDDPHGPDTGLYRASRDGGFASPPFQLRCASRLGVAPNVRRFSIGFRVVYDPRPNVQFQLPIMLQAGYEQKNSSYGLQPTASKQFVYPQPVACSP